MSGDEADPELLELLRQSLGISKTTQNGVSSDTGVLKDAQFIYNNAIDVSVDMYGTKGAAAAIYQNMQERGYSTQTWAEHELHPKMSEGFSEVDIVNFVFTMDLLNFSFWSDLSKHERFQVEYRSRRWTGYTSLVACLRRALDEGIPVTTPRFWRSRSCSDHVFEWVFRSATPERIPLLEERIKIMREAGNVLRESFANPDDEDNVVDGADEDDTLPNINDLRIDGDEVVSDSQSYPEQAELDSRTDGAIAEATYDAANVSTIAEPTVGSRLPEISLDQLSLNISPPRSAGADGDKSNDRPEIETASGTAKNTVSKSTDKSHTPADSPGQTSSSQLIAKSIHRPPTSTDQISSQSPSTHPPVVRPTDLKPDHTVIRLIQRADHSAGKLVNLLVHHFECFRDESRFEGKRVRLLKRAQIFVADVWAALHGTGLGEFHDIDHLTMFADYRVPQCLSSLGVLSYSPPLDHHIRSLRRLEAGHSWEVQLRGCSIWAIELIRREIVATHPEADGAVNAVLIDFFLYDLAKEKEARGVPALPHHRTRSIWY